MSGRPLTNQENAERLAVCERMVANGASTGDVARHLEISVAAVSQWLVRQGQMELREKLQANANRGRRIDGQTRATFIVEAIGRGRTRKEIAKVLKISPPALTTWVINNQDVYPELKPFVKRGSFRGAKPKTGRPPPGAMVRKQTVKLKILIEVRRFMQQGFTIQDASFQAGRGKSYAYTNVVRAGHKPDYHGLNMTIGDLWEMFYPDEDDPIEYEKMPKSPKIIRDMPGAQRRLKWHLKRWRQQEGLTVAE